MSDCTSSLIHVVGKQRMSLSLCFIPLAKGPKISASEIQRDLRQTWPTLPTASETKKDDNTISFRLGEASVVLGLMPAPIPWSDLEGPCATSWLWPKGAEELRPHTSHLIVTVSSEEGPLERAKLLSQVAAAILATCPQAIGVYWGNAALIISRPVFRDFAVQVLPRGLPLYIWVDFRVGRNPAGGCSGFTTGLKALGHMELETQNSPEQPGELRERFFGLGCYLLENGPVIRDGDTVGEDANEKIKVTYSPSAFGQESPVMRLDYSSAAKKPWWKPW